MPLHIDTPLLESRHLGLLTGQNIWLKFDALQPCGSFKIRGIGAACEHYARQGKKRFISSSGGNAGIAVAYAGRCLSIPVTVVVPQTTTERAKALIRQENAEVIVHGASWMEANAHAQSLLTAEDAFLHPFDNPLLWQGHATLIDEVAQAGLVPDAVVLSVGGGGLLSGIVEGLKRNGWGHVPVIAAETEGASSLAQSVKAGRRVELAAIDSVATSLGAKQVCEQAFELTKSHPITCAVVSDREALSACERFLADHRVLVEPACGASLSLVYERRAELAGYRNVLVVVCGGVTASLEQIREWMK
ncbi:pyridoxal-phosphate dependent enzyme [Pseudomonas akapageensis]|uniref:pyridoxal-phosphate dependent enzyme n=1 Tax=Pseudomonas akapageensis TaxID=2609961 RepID=UPI00140D9C02|nr:pyridoxal-phosphate dependent enzyme [Pseudomonas akapageensis]